MPSQARRAWRKLSLYAVTALLTVAFAGPAKAVYQWEILGGELEVTGFLRSETRFHFEDSFYLKQWVNKFQLEATQTWQEVGPFDELALTTVIRPEFDVAYYYKGLTDNHIGRGATGSTWFTDPFSESADPQAWNGFNPAFRTGGLNKNVEQGIWDARELTNFATNPSGSFPITMPRDGRGLNCHRCRNQSNGATNIALNRTDSSGKLYPFRELYMDATVGDLWVRLGKQMVVWGKTDNFRLMDIINPVDFGPHYFYDPFEDIRIPQWILSAQYRPGSIGPFTDTSFQFIWNFDEYQAVGLGNPGGAQSFPFGWTGAAAGMFNTYFSAEPCLGTDPAFGGVAPGTTDADGQLSCFNTDGSPAKVAAGAGFGPGINTTGAGSNGGRNYWPSGFGVPLGLKEDERPEWKLKNTEVGLRIEARLGMVRFALTNYWGWGDTPVFAWDSLNVITGATTTGGAQNDILWADRSLGFAGGGGFPMNVLGPRQALNLALANGDAGAASARAAGDALLFFQGGCPAELGVPNPNPSGAPNANAIVGFCNVIGGRTKVVYKKNNTTGLAVDYFEDFTGIVFRLESSLTVDELVNNTKKVDFVDDTNVMRFSLGMDRPTFIHFLNPTRTFFLSGQVFHTWLINHDGTSSRGMLTDQNTWIFTFFAQGQYMRDRLTPQGFIVWDQQSNGWIAGSQVQYLFNNNWSAAIGGNFQWGGRRNEFHDNGAFTSFVYASSPLNPSIPPGDPPGLGGGRGRPVQRTFFGDAQNGATCCRKNDEFFFRVQYQF